MLSEGELDAAWTAARTAWPQLGVPRERFAAFLSARAGDGLGGLRVVDLYVACGCIDGDPAAMQAFESLLAEAAVKLPRVAYSDDDLAEAKQRTRQLLLPRAGRTAALADYAGRGDIRGWLRVALGRELVRLLRRRKEAPGAGSGDIARAADQADDPETAYLKRHYRSEFKEAFAVALTALDPDERRLLRYAVIERLGIDDIAQLEGVHRATAARQVGRARQRLVAETRRALGARLRVEPSRLQSIFGLIESQLDVSVQRLLVGT
jgi:RNA polymerase sigma-70 factor (ECF subfamily)